MLQSWGQISFFRKLSLSDRNTPPSLLSFCCMFFPIFYFQVVIMFKLNLLLMEESWVFLSILKIFAIYWKKLIGIHIPFTLNVIIGMVGSVLPFCKLFSICHIQYFFPANILLNVLFVLLHVFFSLVFLYLLALVFKFHHLNGCSQNCTLFP